MPRCLFRLVLFLPLFPAPVTLHAVEFTRNGLLERTPFTRIVPAADVASSGGAYELRGFFGREGEREVSIHYRDTGRSEWVRVGAEGGKWSVESADVESGTAVLVVDGVRIRLRLASSAGASASSSLPEHYDMRRHKRTGPVDDSRMGNDEETPFARARDAGLARLRAEHPEYFTEINSLTDEQRRAAANAIEEVGRRAEAEAGARS